MPTGATPREDCDGISIAPTLLSTEKSQSPQKQHKYLYWELGGSQALRKDNWKIVRKWSKRKKLAATELYDLGKDIAESKDLAEKNPNARILLSYRNSDDWYDSFHNTIYQAMIRDTPPEPAWVAVHLEMTRQLVLEQALGGRPDDRAHAIRCYEEHNDAVRSEVASDRLILHEVGAGWEPLCLGLNLPVPDKPYPKTNNTREFRERMALMGS